MKKITWNYLKWIILVNGLVLLIQIALIISLTLSKIAYDIISNSFFVILVVVVASVIATNYFMINKKNKRVGKDQKIYLNEEDIGYEMMVLNPKIIDEKEGFIQFNNKLSFYLLSISCINVIVALISAIVFSLI